MRGAAAQLRDHARDVRKHLAQRRPGHRCDQDIAGRDTRKLTFAIHDACTPRAPADSRWVTAESRMLEPNLVRDWGWRHMQRPRLEQLEARIVERPLDLDRHAANPFRFAEHAPELSRLRGVEAWRAKKRPPDAAATVGAADLAIHSAGPRIADLAVPAQHVLIGHHLALSDGRPEARCGAQQHSALGSQAQSAAGHARVYEWLDVQSHGSVRGIEIVRRHVAQRAGGPERCPARAHRREKVRLALQAEEALELTREAGPEAIFDQRR